MQYYPQQPQQPYPQQAYPQQPYPQQPQQVYPQQPYPQPVYQQQYVYPPYQPPVSEEYLYRRRLKRTANGLGALLLIFVALQAIVLVALQLIMRAANVDGTLEEGSILSFLESGVVSCVVFFVAGLVYCLITKKSVAQVFPFHKVSPSLVFKMSIIGLSFSLMSNYVVDMLDNTFHLFGFSTGGGSFDMGSQPNILLYFLTVAVMPALVEEFAFRGVIMGALKPYSQGLAILVSSAVFALMHGNFVQMPFTFCCGLVFAYIDIKANSLLPSIIIHFLNNGLSVLSDVLISYHILNDTTANLAYGVIFTVTGVLSFFFIKELAGKMNGGAFRFEGGNDVIPFKTKVKTVATSPTMIIFTVIMVITSVTYLTFSLPSLS